VGHARAVTLGSKSRRTRYHILLSPLRLPPTRRVMSAVLRWTLYRTPVGSLENAVLCCALITKPYHSNEGAILLRVCVAMGMLLHSNEHSQISIIADRLSMFATYGRIPWEASTPCYYRRSIGQSVLVSATHVVPKTRFLLLLDSCRFVEEGRRL
jgi:hypothetical protein